MGEELGNDALLGNSTKQVLQKMAAGIRDTSVYPYTFAFCLDDDDLGLTEGPCPATPAHRWNLKNMRSLGVTKLRCIAGVVASRRSTSRTCPAIFLYLTSDSGYAVQSAALGRMKPGLIGPVTGPRVKFDYGTAPPRIIPR
jgi:hypothetical protein